MKIIVNDSIYVQVRDILFIAKYYNNKKILDYYLSLINSNHSDNEFIKSSNDLLNKLLRTDLIIDFRDYQDYSDLHLSNLIVSLSSTFSDDKGVLEHKLDDLRDIISLKRRELNYTIPLIPDDKVNEYYEDLNLRFRSTIFSNYYLIEASSKGIIDEYNFNEALRRGLKKLNEQGLKNSMSYHLINKGSYMVIAFNDEKKKKQGLFNKITKRFKKEQ